MTDAKTAAPGSELPGLTYDEAMAGVESGQKFARGAWSSGFGENFVFLVPATSETPAHVDVQIDGGVDIGYVASTADKAATDWFPVVSS